MSAQSNKEIVRKMLEDTWNEKSVAIMDELMTADYVFRDVGNPDMSLQEDKQYTKSLLAAFPDMHITIDDVFGEGDRVVVRFAWTGTHQGEFKGIPATGKELSGSGIGIYRLVGGKIAEVWSVSDKLGFLQQLGLIPSME